MLDCSEQDGASGDTEEKMWRRTGGFSRGDGLGIVARAWRDSDGISRNATCFLGGWRRGSMRGGNRKERVGEGRGGATVERRRAASGRERLEVSQRLSRQSTKSLKERRYS